ncbi:hypothetical protein L3X38_032620 [Prunus dulcis]|uniref:Uncharacterized protein n=1 Tax=Prunus dulcis TaxID=3755 RepID=A0AAD4VFI5_PRUDU|nr:hypothetical protein L3X38_032620 [Prunus dulcis]
MTSEGNFVQPSISRFDGHYDHWSMLMENFLRSKEFWSLIETGYEEPKTRARPLLMLKMARPILSLAAESFGKCLAPRKCVFLRHRRRRGCLGASRFDAGSARFIMV